MRAHFKSDDSSKVCEACGRAFAVYRRRHHCRACGGLFCNDCSSKRCEVAYETGPQRVCGECFSELSSSQDSSRPSAGSPDLRASIAGPARPVMPSESAFTGIVGGQLAAPLGPSPGKAPSWANQLPDYVNTPPPAAAPAAEEPEPEQEEVIPPNPASVFAKALFFYAITDTPVYPTFDLAHDTSDEQHIVGYIKTGQVVEALQTKVDEIQGVQHVKLHNGWILQEGPNGRNIKRIRSYAEVRRMQAEFELGQSKSPSPRSRSNSVPSPTVSSPSTTTSAASVADFDPMGATTAPPSDSLGSRQAGVSFAPDTKNVERTPAARAGTPIQVVNVTKQRGSERYTAEVQWKITGTQGKYRLVMKENLPATVGGMAVGAAVDIKQVQLVRMLCENSGLQFTEQREAAAGTRVTVAEILGGDRIRVNLNSGEVVAFPAKALQVAPVEAPKWKKASKDPVTVHRGKRLAEQTVYRLKPGVSYTFKAQAKTLEGKWADCTLDSEPCVPAGDLEMTDHYEQSLPADPYQLEKQRRASELSGITQTTPLAARKKFDTEPDNPVDPASLTKRSPDQPTVAELMSTRRKQAAEYEKQAQAEDRLRSDESRAARQHKPNATAEKIRDAKEKAEREILAKQAAEALIAGQKAAEEKLKQERWAENARQEREKKAAEAAEAAAEEERKRAKEEAFQKKRLEMLKRLDQEESAAREAEKARAAKQKAEEEEAQALAEHRTARESWEELCSQCIADPAECGKCSGETYYHCIATGETSWFAPRGWHVPPPRKIAAESQEQEPKPEPAVDLDVSVDVTFAQQQVQEPEPGPGPELAPISASTGPLEIDASVEVSSTVSEPEPAPKLQQVAEAVAEADADAEAEEAESQPQTTPELEPETVGRTRSAEPEPKPAESQPQAEPSEMPDVEAKQEPGEAEAAVEVSPTEPTKSAAPIFTSTGTLEIDASVEVSSEVTEPETVPKPQQVAESMAEDDAEIKLEPELEPEPESEPVPEPQSEPEPDLESKPKSESEPNSEPLLESLLAEEPELEPEPEPEPKLQPVDEAMPTQSISGPIDTSVEVTVVPADSPRPARVDDSDSDSDSSEDVLGATPQALREAREASERNAAAEAERQRGGVTAVQDEPKSETGQASVHEEHAAPDASATAEARNSAQTEEDKAAAEAQAEAAAAAEAEAELMAHARAISVSEMDVSVEVGPAAEPIAQTNAGSGSLRLVPAEPVETPGGDPSTTATAMDDEERKAAQRAEKKAKVREAKLRQREAKMKQREANADRKKVAEERLVKHASGEVSPDAVPVEDMTPKSAWRATAKAVVRNEGLVGASGVDIAPATAGPGKLTVMIIEAQGLVVPLLSGLDPYVSLSAAGTTVCSSNVPVTETMARWSETKSLDIPAGHNVLLFELMDKSRWGSDTVLGQKEVRLQQVREQREVAEILSLVSPDGASAPKLQVRMRFEITNETPAASVRRSSAAEGKIPAARRSASALAIADEIIADTEPLMVCTFGEGRLGIGFDRNSVPPLAVTEVNPAALAAAYPGLTPGFVLQTVQGQSVTGMPYDDVLALIKQSRPAGPTELGFSRPLATDDDEL